MQLVTRPACPICSNQDAKAIYRASFDTVIPFLAKSYGARSYDVLRGHEFVLLQCANCSLLYQQNIPDDELASVLYNEWVDAEADRFHQLRKKQLSHRLSLIREIVAGINFLNRPPAELRVFDFGMGWGAWCMAAQGLGCHVSGSDLAKDRREWAERHGIEVLPWSEIPHGNFDYMNAEEVFEHLISPLETLLHLKKGLRKGGIIRISVPNGRTLGALKIDWNALPLGAGPFNAIFPLEHINAFTNKSLVALGRQAGLERIDISASSWFRNFVKVSSVREIVDFTLRLTPYARSRSTILYFRN